MEKTVLERSEELADYLWNNKEVTIDRIIAEEEENVKRVNEWRFIKPPLYLLYSETEKELQNPASLFYHLSAILNRKEGLLLEDTGDLEEEIKILKEDLIVLSLDLLQRMGANSKFGDVLDANMNVDYMHIVLKDKFVVKIPKDSSRTRKRSVRNEFIIGYYGVNYVRRLIPNFIFTYGYFECGRPTEDDFCAVVEEEDKIGYMVIEKVTNTENTTDFLERATNEETRIFLLQTALAFAIAEKTIHFTHNDAHLGNILIRRLPEKQVITYRYEGNTYHVLTDFIVVIIDYGYARAYVSDLRGRSEEQETVLYRTECLLNDRKYYYGPCAINDFARVLISTLFIQGYQSSPKAYHIYELLTNMRYKYEEMSRWSKIYFAVYPPSSVPFADIIAILYEEKPKAMLAAAPVYVNITHETPSRLNSFVLNGNIKITNVLQYFEYVIGYTKYPKYPELTDKQREYIADRTITYLYQLYPKREKKSVRRLILSYARLYAFFLVKESGGMSESGEMREDSVLYKYGQKFGDYMRMFPEIDE